VPDEGTKIILVPSAPISTCYMCANRFQQFHNLDSHTALENRARRAGVIPSVRTAVAET